MADQPIRAVRAASRAGSRPVRAAHWRRRAAQLAAAAALCAGAGAAGAIDLGQAYQAALEHDAVIRAARLQAQAQRERLPQAKAQLLPSVTLSANSAKNRLTSVQPNAQGQETSTRSSYSSGNQTLTVRQPLLRMYQFSLYHQAEAQVAQANADLEREEQNLVVRVAGAYLDALLAQDQLGLIEAQKKFYATQLDAARKGMEAGFATRTDIDDAQARLDLATATELELRQSVDLTRRQLEALVGRPLDALAPLDAARFTPLPPAPASLDAWTARAEDSSPEMRSLRASLEAARREVDKAKAGHYPTLDATAQWSRSDSENITRVDSGYINRSIGVQLNIPLYSGGYVSSQVRQALAEVQRVEQAIEATRRDLGVRVHREYRGVTEGVLKIRALEQASRSAEQLVESTRRSYQAGFRTQVDVLNAEQQRMATLRDLSQARYMQLAARVRLQSLAGDAGPGTIDEINRTLTP